MKRVLGLGLLVALMAGCAKDKSLYSWGHYEALIYQTYSAPGKISPELQIERLEEDYQKARAKNKRMHPGFHAHLGYLYYQMGKLDAARTELETEKAEFPESAVFVDRLLANLRK